MGRRQTVETQLRRRKMRRLIRVSTVFLQKGLAKTDKHRNGLVQFIIEENSIRLKWVLKDDLDLFCLTIVLPSFECSNTPLLCYKNILSPRLVSKYCNFRKKSGIGMFKQVFRTAGCGLIRWSCVNITVPEDSR